MKISSINLKEYIVEVKLKKKYSWSKEKRNEEKKTNVIRYTQRNVLLSFLLEALNMGTDLTLHYFHVSYFPLYMNV